MRLVTIKRTEPALRNANVGVVDVAIDNERDPPRRMPLPPQVVGQSAERKQVGFGLQPEGFGPVEKLGRVKFSFNLLKHSFLRCEMRT
jgi:hypothetical protein